jgi:hypothetical protein
MRRLIFAALLAAAPMLMLESTPASACGWFGDRGNAPRTYSKAYRARPAVAGYTGYGRWCDWGMRGLGW